MTVQQVIYAMIEGYLAQVGGVAPRPPIDEATLNSVTITKLKAPLAQLRFEIDALDIATVREKRPAVSLWSSLVRNPSLSSKRRRPALGSPVNSLAGA